jgi:translation initiation factor 2 beta subunit (eIF-2beta)/eIF-5
MSSKTINIRGKKEIIDPFYRYKMGKVIITKEKTKIIFTNIDKIAKELDRTSQEIVSFLKKFFGTSFTYSDGKANTTKQLSQEELQNAIYEFIEINILCRKCSNPETEIVEEKNKKIMRCKACNNLENI